MDVTKMTAAQLADMTAQQFNSLTASEASKALQILRRSVNQKIRRVEKSGEPSPALEGLKRSGGRLKAGSGLSRNETLTELKRGMDFIKSKTSTVTGARKVKQKALEDLGLRKDTTAAEATDAYNMFNKLKEEFPTLLNKATGGESYQSYKKRVGQMIQRGDDIDTIRNELQMIYEEESARQAAEAASLEQQFL